MKLFDPHLINVTEGNVYGTCETYHYTSICDAQEHLNMWKDAVELQTDTNVKNIKNGYAFKNHYCIVEIPQELLHCEAK